MRFLLSLLMAVAALSLSPVRAWAEDHGHCEEPASAQAAAPAPVATPPELSAPAAPCTDCPGGPCSTHRHCAVGTPPVVAEVLLIGYPPPPVPHASPITTTGLAPSFDPTPPTPPPNLRAR